MRSGAPIFAAEEVIAESAIEFEHEVEDTEEVVDKFKEFLDQVSPEDFAGRRAVSGRSGRRPRERELEHALDQRVEADPGRLGGLRQQATSRSGPGSRWPRARTARRCVLEHQVDPREAVAAEQPVVVERELLRARGRPPSASSAGQTKSVRPIS